MERGKLLLQFTLPEIIFFRPVNSVKWLRGRKKAWKSRKGSKKGKKPKKTETDSQHTQVIEMELGKAARLVFCFQFHS